MKEQFVENLEMLKHLATSGDEIPKSEFSNLAHKLSELEPELAASVFWTVVGTLDNEFVVRVSTYLCAKTANSHPRHLWLPVNDVMLGPDIVDESTILNLLTSIQITLANRDGDFYSKY